MASKHEQRDPRPQPSENHHAAPPKKPFVEPTISSPVDVLEATTFFQTVESGGTGLTGRRRE